MVNALANMYYCRGEHEKSDKLHRRVMEERDRMLGPDHEETLAGVDKLAELYNQKGNFIRAEPMYRRALECRERILGPDHIDTLVSCHA